LGLIVTHNLTGGYFVPHVWYTPQEERNNVYVKEFSYDETGD
jgi:hypothetical protein